MSFKSIIVSTCAYALFTATFTSNAATILVYTGNSYDTFSQPSSYDTNMSVSLTLVLNSPLMPNWIGAAPVHTFSITDGLNQIDSGSGVNGSFTLETDAEAVITGWWIHVDNFYPGGNFVGEQYVRISTTTWDHPFTRVYSPLDMSQEYTCTSIIPGTFPVMCETWVLSDSGSLAASPGSWEVIPVPAAIWLFGSGLLGLIGVARRKVRV